MFKDFMISKNRVSIDFSVFMFPDKQDLYAQTVIDAVPNLPLLFQRIVPQMC